MSAQDGPWPGRWRTEYQRCADAEAKLARILELCDAEDRRWRGLVGLAATAISTRELRSIIGEAPSDG